VRRFQVRPRIAKRRARLRGGEFQCGIQILRAFD
jgi:hypothetical protein